MNQRLKLWCDANDILSESQAGFRSGYCPTDHIYIYIAGHDSEIPGQEKWKILLPVYWFSKAFDCVYHDILFKSLQQFGISGNFFKFIVSMYSKLSACVRTDTGLSNYFKCNVGTRQGCILSPQIFILFINQLVVKMEENGGRGIFISTDTPNIFALMYADDVASVSDSCMQMQGRLAYWSSFVMPLEWILIWT